MKDHIGKYTAWYFPQPSLKVPLSGQWSIYIYSEMQSNNRFLHFSYRGNKPRLYQTYLRGTISQRKNCYFFLGFEVFYLVRIFWMDSFKKKNHLPDSSWVSITLSSGRLTLSVQVISPAHGKKHLTPSSGAGPLHNMLAQKTSGASVNRYLSSDI